MGREPLTPFLTPSPPCPRLAKGQVQQKDVSDRQPCLALVQRKYSLKHIKMK